MKTKSLIPVLLGVAAAGAWQIRDLLAESLWYGVTLVLLLVVALIFQVLYERPGDTACRGALLFGVGTIAVASSTLVCFYGWSCLRLKSTGGAEWFDPVWFLGFLLSCGLSGWLWRKWYRIARPTAKR